MLLPPNHSALNAAMYWPHVHPATSVEVSVDVKVIAGGIKLKNGKRKLQFSLVFSPKAPDGGPTFQLADWPSKIEDICADNLSVLVSCLPASFSAKAARPGLDRAAAISLRVEPVRPEQRRAAIDAISACWQTIIGIGDPSHKKTPWEALQYIFRQGGGQSAQSAASIVGIPRGDMAIFLQSWRARVALGRLVGDITTGMEPGCDYLATLQDWVMSSTELGEMAFGDLGPTTQAEVKVDQTVEARQELANEIDKRRIAEQEKNENVRKKAVDGSLRILDGRTRYLGEQSSAGALKAHNEQCTPQTFCEAPFSITADLMGGDSKTIHELYGTYRRLHQTQLSFDDQLKKHYEPAGGTKVEQVGKQATWSPPAAVLPEKVDPDFLEAVAAVKRKLFTLQAMPSLARVFRFVVDAEADLGDLPASPEDLPTAQSGGPAEDMMAVLGQLKPLQLFEADSVDADAFGDVSSLISSEVTQTVTNYLFLSVPYGNNAPWTAVKLRYPTGNPAALAAVSGHFMPCSMEEMDLAAVIASPDGDAGLSDRVDCSRNCSDANGNPRRRYILPAIRDGLLLQFDGVLDLGAGRRAISPSERRPRYDLLSLDVVAAMESQANLVRTHTGRDLTRGVHARPTYRSAGMMLVDRWRAAAMAYSRADAEHRSIRRKEGEPVIFDATSITVGYRIDVGIRQKGQTSRLHKWRTLGNRIVRYSYPLQPSLIEDELARLGLPARSEQRIRLDSTPILPGASADSSSRYPEEILVCWEGDPLGVQCVEDPGGKSSTVGLDPSQDLAISRFYELPDDGEPSFRIWKLTFGKRYRCGLRADYLGGVTAPLERVRAIYEEASGGMLALPEAPVPAGGKWKPADPDGPRAKGRRFLRHERLLSPEVAIPEQEIEAARRLGDRPRLRDQSALEAVVRTARPVKGSSTSLDTDRISRILIAPGVPQDFAERHGVLNAPDLFAGRRKLAKGASIEVVVAADGLKNAAYDAEKGGLRRRTVKNLASIAASLVADDEKRTAQDFNDRDGDPVFAIDSVVETMPTRSGARARKHVERTLPYFPDPAAHVMVLAMRKPRFAGEKQPASWEDPEHRNVSDYIGGDPAVLDLTHPSLRYPDTLAVVLEVQRAPNAAPRRLEGLTHEAAMPWRHRTTGSIDRGGFVPGRIDSTMIGRGKVPAVSARIELAPGEEFELDTWCVPSVEQLDRWFDIVETSAMLAIIKQCIAAPDNSLSADQACSAGLATLLGSSEALQFDRLLREYGAIAREDNECSIGALPIPGPQMRREIAEKLHAYMRKRPIPEIAAVQTVRIAHAVGTPNFAPAFRPSTTHTATRNMQRGGLDIIRLGLTTGGKVPARTNTPAEAAEKQDRKLRDFIATHRVEDWHGPGKPSHDLHATALLVGGSIAVDLDTCASATVYANMAHPYTAVFDDVLIGRRNTGEGHAPKYGFKVLPSHRVEFESQQVILARLEGLQPSREINDRQDGPEVVDLLFDGVNLRKGQRGYQPTDYKARRMLLSIEATTRFRSDFDWAPKLGVDSAAEGNPGNALFDAGAVSGWIRSSETETAPNGKTYDIWIPASKRPDPIDPVSILPAFVWHEEQIAAATTTLTRRTLVRLRFRRPWFSSGEGERLGIVLWPPQIFDMSPIETDFPLSLAGDAEDLIKKELDEGTGYITRSGLDPIRQGGTHATGSFMPLEAFHLDGNELVTKVPRVTMPLPIEPDRLTENKEHRTLDVALLAFEPLFDPVDELWYVDVDISGRQMPDGWVRFGLVRYQSHAIAGQEVSEPTITYAQMLPRRRVRVDRIRSSGSEGSMKVRVTVEGVGSLAAAKDNGVTDPDELLLMQRPVLAMTMTRTTVPPPMRGRGRGAGIEEMIDADDSQRRPSEFNGPKTDDGYVRAADGYVRATHGDDGLVWTKEFELADPPPDGGKYRLMIEEIDLRPAASPEPGQSTLVESGPRFIATLEI